MAVVVNRYSLEFVVDCPANSVPVRYAWVIESSVMIRVETLRGFVRSLKPTYHEELADLLFKEFGGQQTLTAEHHSVLIVTERQP